MTESFTADVDNQYKTGSEVGPSGFRQVYYQKEGKEKQYIETSGYASIDPHTDGTTIVFATQIEDGSWQIFSYDIPTQSLSRISFSVNNAHPFVENGKIVWEGIVDGSWQIFYYDGISVKQLTSGDLSQNPVITDTYLIFGRRNAQKVWRTVVYDTQTKQSKVIATGRRAEKPILEGGNILLAGDGSGDPYTEELDSVFHKFKGNPGKTTYQNNSLFRFFETPRVEVSNEPTPTPSPTPEFTIDDIKEEVTSASESAIITNESEGSVKESLDEKDETPAPSTTPSPTATPDVSPEPTATPSQESE